MRLFVLTALTMAAFAANSLLARAGIAGIGGLDPMLFAGIRLSAGALVLWALARRRGALPWRGPGRAAAVFGLLLYMFAFSLAYLRLDAGLGALVLFGAVQVTMFAGALAEGARPPVLRWLGAGIAFGGLVWLLLPAPEQAGRANQALSQSHLLIMALAGIGWGVYSLAGRKAAEPLAATAANFTLAAPVGLALVALLPGALDGPVAGWGIVLAVISGAVTSGLGYALWYAILPRLEASVAAVAQLTVPPIAMAGGMIFLGEALTLRFSLAALVILGGVALSVLGPVYLTRRSSGS